VDVKRKPVKNWEDEPEPVYVGGVGKDGKTPKDTRTPGQKAALIDLVKALIAKYPTVKKVTGHNQYAAKACPSFDVRKDELGTLA